MDGSPASNHNANPPKLSGLNCEDCLEPIVATDVIAYIKRTVLLLIDEMANVLMVPGGRTSGDGRVSVFVTVSEMKFDVAFFSDQ